MQSEDAQHLFETATAAFLAGQRLEDNALVRIAQQKLAHVKSLQGTNGVEVDFAQAQVAQYLKQWEQAEAGYRSVLDSVPDNPLVRNNLAIVLMELGKDMSEAEQLALSATQLSSKDPNLYDTLAIVYLKQRQLDSASKAIDKAIALDPNNPTWHLTRADILEAKGNVDLARSIREQYKQLLRN
jgi:Flp pilus assembly protein TadD